MKELLNVPLIKNIGITVVEDLDDYLELMVGYHEIDIELIIGSNTITVKVFKDDEVRNLFTTKHSFGSVSKFVNTVLNKEYKGYETFYVYSVFSEFTEEELNKFLKYFE